MITVKCPECGQFWESNVELKEYFCIRCQTSFLYSEASQKSENVTDIFVDAPIMRIRYCPHDSSFHCTDLGHDLLAGCNKLPYFCGEIAVIKVTPPEEAEITKIDYGDSCRGISETGGVQCVEDKDCGKCRYDKFLKLARDKNIKK